MQENRSFDSYFGTFPGANGIPAGTCVPLDPANPGRGCITPFHDRHDVNAGGPHSYPDAAGDIDVVSGLALMDGFAHQQTTGGSTCNVASGNAEGPRCTNMRDGVSRHDAVGYHTDAEIPNYWSYARSFVLQDNLFEGDRGWSPDSHLEMVSEWSARCADPLTLSTCVSNHLPATGLAQKAPVYPWVSLFQLMDINSVSWKYYLANGTEPDCDDGEMTCDPQKQISSVLSFWNPLPGFAWVRSRGANYVATHNPDVNQFLVDLKQGTLPQVSWLVPSSAFSEHPPSGVTAGMEYVTSLVNAVMASPYWQSTAIFISWDDWGGFYDHVPPPVVDYNSDGSQVQGYGLRVPGLMISPYARAGMIDHALLSFDSYAVLIEKLFMNGAHLDPVAMGQPDNRPTVRDAITSATYPDGSIAQVGDLLDEFDFTQAPLPTLVLSTHIPTGIMAACGGPSKAPERCTKSSVQISWKPVEYGQVAGPFTYGVLRDGVLVQTSPNPLYVDTAPGTGTHYYTAYSIDASGVQSPASAAAEADVP